MSKKSGSILFELFIALMILSIAIAQTLRVFSEALYLGQRNVEQAEIKKNIDHLIFEWSGPGNSTFSGTGFMTIPIKTEHSRYECEVNSQKISFQNIEPAEQNGALRNTNAYYQVHFVVKTEKGMSIFDFDTILMRATQ